MMIEPVVEVMSFDEADAADRRYWWSRTPAERVAHVIWLRRMNYGADRASGRLCRLLEVVDRPRG